MRDNRLWQAALRRWFEAGSALVAVLLSAERERWPLWLPVGAGLGIALYFLIPFEPPLWLGPLAASGALVGGILAWRRPSGFLLVLALGMVGVGFAVAQLRTAQVAAPILERRLGPVEVSGQITDLDPRPQGLRMVMEQVQIAGLAADRTPVRVRIRLGAAAAEGLHPGQWVSLRAVLMPPPGPVAPGAFDFQRYLYFKQLGAVGYAVVSAVRPVARDDAEGGDSWRMWLSSLRQTVFSRVVAGIDGAPGAIAAALMTGERGAIPKDVLKAVRDSGLAHLLAISGLHIGLFAGILFLGTRTGLALIGPVARRFPIKKWAAVVAVAGAFPYLLITGATVPTQRAFMMTGLVLLAILVDRTAISMRLVAWAAVIILVMTPESLLGASFQMSFAAVIALIAAYEVLRERLVTWRAAGGWWRRPGIYLTGIALTTLIAGSATAPFVLYHFNRFAGYGLVANLVAVPLTALWIMPWAMAAFVGRRGAHLGGPDGGRLARGGDPAAGHAGLRAGVGGAGRPLAVFVAAALAPVGPRCHCRGPSDHPTCPAAGRAGHRRRQIAGGAVRHGRAHAVVAPGGAVQRRALAGTRRPVDMALMAGGGL